MASVYVLSLQLIIVVAFTNVVSRYIECINIIGNEPSNNYLGSIVPSTATCATGYTVRVVLFAE